MATDKSFSMRDLAAEVARISCKPAVYKDVPESAYKEMLEGFGRRFGRR